MNYLHEHLYNRKAKSNVAQRENLLTKVNFDQNSIDIDTYSIFPIRPIKLKLNSFVQNFPFVILIKVRIIHPNKTIRTI